MGYICKWLKSGVVVILVPLTQGASARGYSIVTPIGLMAQPNKYDHRKKQWIFKLNKFIQAKK